MTIMFSMVDDMSLYVEVYIIVVLYDYIIFEMCKTRVYLRKFVITNFLPGRREVLCSCPLFD